MGTAMVARLGLGLLLLTLFLPMQIYCNQTSLEGFSSSQNSNIQGSISRDGSATLAGLLALSLSLLHLYC
ncbi:signal transducer CD24-like [Meriones unguiculatus]|uniref:signal transducer CD24-like n=1 Tax=Meriones unguiculatus TaxID=10047 RepID=UPI00108B6B1D|nr:signal transducer CD24-like [Meriones unguiculatus]